VSAGGHDPGGTEDLTDLQTQAFGQDGSPELASGETAGLSGSFRKLAA